MRIGVISDTHGLLRPEVFRHFAGVHHILHAGDIGDRDILTALEAIAPVDAVYGNTDDITVRAHVAGQVDLEFARRRITLVHGHRLGAPTPERLARAHPDADIVVFGHTHRPLEARLGTQLFLNPGGAGAPRFGLQPTIAILELPDDTERFQLIQLTA